MEPNDHILIVEDERIIAEQMRQLLEDLSYKKVSVAYNFDKAVEVLKSEDITLALLDINLGRSKKDGIELAYYLQTNYKIPFLYVTANADKATVAKAKATHPLGYILKPFTKDSIYSSIEIALVNAAVLKSDINDTIIVLEKGKRKVVRVREVAFLKASGNYVEIHLSEDEKYLSRQSLKDFGVELPGFFVQVHRSYLVNLKRVATYNSTTIKIESCKERIPLGRSFKEVFFKQLEKKIENQ